MGLFSRKRKVTPEEFGLELSRYAQEYAERPDPAGDTISVVGGQGNQGLDEILIGNTGDMKVSELHGFHHWGVVYTLGQLDLDETTFDRVGEAMTDALVQLLGPDLAEECGVNRYMDYRDWFEHAMEVEQLYPPGTFEPHIKTPHGIEHPLQDLIKTLWKNLTGNTECPEDMAHQLHLSYGPEYVLCYLESLHKFAKGFRVTRT